MAEVKRETVEDRGKVTGTAAGRRDTDTNSATADTSTAGRGSGNGNSNPGGRGTAEKVESKKDAGLATVKEDNSVPTPPQPKKTVKKRAKKKQTKKDDFIFNSEQVKALIMGMSGIFACRKGFEMFALTEAEAEQLAKPLSNLIEKSEKLSTVTENADGVMLAITAAIIFVPRFILFFDMRKANKKPKEVTVNGKQINIDNRGAEGKSEKPVKSSNRQSPAPTQGNASDIHSSIPALA